MIIMPRNGTAPAPGEDREMECCHHVLVGGDQFGGITLTHPYIPGQYKKIGVCDGRSLYQHVNNTEIFLYYVCGRWFIGLEVGEGNKKISLELKNIYSRSACAAAGCSRRRSTSACTAATTSTAGTSSRSWGCRATSPSACRRRARNPPTRRAPRTRPSPRPSTASSRAPRTGLGPTSTTRVTGRTMFPPPPQRPHIHSS